MIYQITTVNNEAYIVNGSRHAFEGWVPVKIERDGDWFLVYNKDGIRAEIIANHVVSVIRKEEK